MPAIDLQGGLTQLKGISAQRVKALSKLGLNRVQDLLLYFPRAYDDWSQFTTSYKNGDVVTLEVEVISDATVMRKGRLSWIRLYLALADGGRIQATWFNQPWLKTKLLRGSKLIVHGRVSESGRQLGLVNPAIIAPEERDANGILAIYGLSQGLTQKLMRQAVAEILKEESFLLTDPLPERLRKQYRLATLDFSLRRLHQPKQIEELSIARRRMGFEELFLIRAGLLMLKKQRNQEANAVPVQSDEVLRSKMQSIIEHLPYRPTKAQTRVCNEIFKDMRMAEAMNRLVQGDVGSGKTLVAALAMAYAAFSGGQAVLMAPTTVLAVQHLSALEAIYKESGLKLALITSSTGAAERRKTLAAVANGEIQILVGTHAVLEKEVQFQRLLLAVTDEQHRFGVKQRGRLAESEGKSRMEDNKLILPHRLYLSATPIPRTLALILYGDLDLSILDELPPGRQAIRTVIMSSQEQQQIETAMQEELNSGGQVYVVCPMIEENEDLEISSLMTVADDLAKHALPGAKIGILHGGMKAQEKEQVMQDFLEKRISILVSTTVIEVGVDNPNASLIVILDAERFGLAQLHQLRGRVGRGTRASTCILRSDSEEELAKRRLETMCQSNNGFEIADEDLKLRGPGDFFGTRQHGLPEFRLVNLYEDQELLATVEEAINRYFHSADAFTTDELAGLVSALRERYPELGFDLRL